MNKRILLIFLTIVFPAIVEAQQQPFYTQYILNPFITNPALAGIENYWDVKVSYRNQWQGIAGAPQTTYLTAQGPFKKIQYTKATVSTVPPPEVKKRAATNHWIRYKSIIPHGGIGITFLNDKTGPINRYAVNATYAYHIGLSPKTSISAGMAAGVQGVNLNTAQLNFGATSPIDPAVAMNGTTQEIRPDLSFGIWLYSAFYFLGASVQNAVPLRFNYSTNAADDVLLVPHLMLSAGYKLFLNDQFSFLPSAMVRIVNNTPVSVDINTKVQYQDITWIGFSYRHSQSFAAMLGFNINSTLNVGYSYDIAASRLRNATTGTHEVVIGILLGNRNRVLCPRDFW